jgi:hypothetical protein
LAGRVPQVETDRPAVDEHIGGGVVKNLFGLGKILGGKSILAIGHKKTCLCLSVHLQRTPTLIPGLPVDLVLQPPCWVRENCVKFLLNEVTHFPGTAPCDYYLIEKFPLHNKLSDEGFLMAAFCSWV